MTKPKRKRVKRCTCDEFDYCEVQAKEIVAELHARFPGMLEHFREVLTRNIVEGLSEAHERGRKEGMGEALKLMEKTYCDCAQDGYEHFSSCPELAKKAIRTTMEAK